MTIRLIVPQKKLVKIPEMGVATKQVDLYVKLPLTEEDFKRIKKYMNSDCAVRLVLFDESGGIVLQGQNNRLYIKGEQDIIPWKKGN